MNRHMPYPRDQAVIAAIAAIACVCGPQRSPPLYTQSHHPRLRRLRPSSPWLPSLPPPSCRRTPSCPRRRQRGHPRRAAGRTAALASAALSVAALLPPSAAITAAWDAARTAVVASAACHAAALEATTRSAALPPTPPPPSVPLPPEPAPAHRGRAGKSMRMCVAMCGSGICDMDGAGGAPGECEGLDPPTMPRHGRTHALRHAPTPGALSGRVV